MNVDVDDVVSDVPEVEDWIELIGDDSGVGVAVARDCDVREVADVVEGVGLDNTDDVVGATTVEVSTLDCATADGGLEVSTRRPDATLVA